LSYDSTSGEITYSAGGGGPQGPAGQDGPAGPQGPSGGGGGGVPSGTFSGDYLVWDSSVAQYVVANDKIKLGSYSGYQNQGDYSIAVGKNAGTANQGQRALAIGFGAGFQSQGDYAVAIGQNAGFQNQPASTIILNAKNPFSAVQINATNTNAFYVMPVRAVAQTTVLGYNVSTGEIAYTDLTTLPTSNAGLPPGSLWVDSATRNLKVV
jgi:hypothetical protein